MLAGAFNVPQESQVSNSPRGGESQRDSQRLFTSPFNLSWQSGSPMESVLFVLRLRYFQPLSFECQFASQKISAFWK